MHATSESQEHAFATGRVPEPEEVREGVFAIAVPMLTTSIPFSLCYLVDGGDGSLHLIDTGMDSDGNWELLCGAIASLGKDVADVASLTLTHLHIDHAGMAARARAASGAVVRLHRADARSLEEEATFVDPALLERLLEEWRVPEEHHDALRSVAAARVSTAPHVEIDEPLDGGERLRLGARTWRVLHTPGHTEGHVAIVADAEGLVFTGDHVLPIIHPGVGLGAGAGWRDPLGDYLASLRLVSALDDHEACPGHEFRFVGLAERCEAIAAHHRARGAEALAVARAEPGLSVWETAAGLPWGEGWANLGPSHRLSALRQTAMHLGAWP